MGYGLGIFLLAVGAILSFAVKDNINDVNLTVVGYILMAAGVLSLIMGVIQTAQRTRTSHRQVIERREEPPVDYREEPPRP